MPSSGIQKPSSYFTGDTLRLHYRCKPVNAKYDLRFFTALNIMNAVFWDIKTQSYLTGDTLRLRYRSQPVNAK
jgi:hypothetical protein